MDFQNELNHLNQFRNMVINKIEREVAVKIHTADAHQLYRDAIGKPRDHYFSERAGSIRHDAIEYAFTALRDAVADFILYAAKAHSGQPDYDPVVPEWIDEHAPLFSSSDLSPVYTCWYCKSEVNEQAFDEAKALLANFDVYQLSDQVKDSCTPEHAERKVYQEAAREIVEYFGLSRKTLQSLVKEHKQGFIIAQNIYTRVNEWSHRSKCKREWDGAAANIYRLCGNFEKLSSWSDDDTFMDIARVFNNLMHGHNHDIYFNSRDKFESGKVKLTMFNDKYELLVPKSAVSQMVGFLRTYADNYLYKPEKAA